MVKVRAARRRENTARVELERRLISLHRNRDGLLRNRRHKRRVRVGRDVLLRRERRCNGLARRLALVRTRRRLRLGGLRRDTLVLDDVLKSIVHKAAVAALVALRRGAIHELLLREADERTVGEEPRTLHRARRGERPARAALLLVLHGCDRTLRRPINGRGEGRDGNTAERLIDAAVRVAETVEERTRKTGLPLLRREIRKLVDTHRPRMIARIMGLNEGDVGVLDRTTVRALSGRIRLAVHHNPFIE